METFFFIFTFFSSLVTKKRKPKGLGYIRVHTVDKCIEEGWSAIFLISFVFDE